MLRRSYGSAKFTGRATILSGSVLTRSASVQLLERRNGPLNRHSLLDTITGSILFPGVLIIPICINPRLEILFPCFSRSAPGPSPPVCQRPPPRQSCPAVASSCFVRLLKAVSDSLRSQLTRRCNERTTAKLVSQPIR